MSGDRHHRTIGRLNLSRRDVALMVTSLLLAFSIWFLYNMRLRYSAPLKVLVTAESNIPGHFNTSSTPTLVEARCRAAGFTMLRLSRHSDKPVTVRFDTEIFHQVSADEYSVTANELSAYIGELFGPEVVLESFLSPSFIFRFPVENHKTVPVVPVKVVDFKDQYTYTGDMSVYPDSVIVYGESAYIDNIDQIRTQRISLSNVSSSCKGSVRLDVPKNVRLSDKTVSYSLDVVRYVEITKNVALSLRNAPAGCHLSVYPSEASVTFKCVFPVGTDRTDDVPVFIDYEDFASSVDGRCVARIDDLPSGVISCSVKPLIFECVENEI